MSKKQVSLPRIT